MHCYTGVVEICLAAAAKRDPQGLALHYYKNGEPMEDQQGLQAYMARMTCYKHVLEMLHKLLNTSHPVLSGMPPREPGPPPAPDPNSLPPAEATEYADNVFHVSVLKVLWILSII